VVAAVAVYVTTYEHSFWFDRTSGYRAGQYKVAGVRVWSYSCATSVSHMLSATYDPGLENRLYLGSSFVGGVSCNLRNHDYMVSCHNAAAAIEQLGEMGKSAQLLRKAMTRLDEVLAGSTWKVVSFDGDADGRGLAGRDPDGTILFRVSVSDTTNAVE
jgi:hypothetical protein